MGRSTRSSVVVSAVIAWSAIGATGTALGADPAAAIDLDDGPKLAIGLATVAFLVVLLLVLRTARARGRRAELEASEPAPASAPEPASPEEHIPRWRRPSVVAGRFGLSTPGTARAERLAFEPAGDAPVERLLIRYDAVPLTDEPDDVHGRTIDELCAGDEVEIVDRQTLWVHVRTPAGRVGWVPAMTLATPEELPPELWEMPAERVEEAPPDDGPRLEALLEAIVAQRRTAAGDAPAAALAAPRAKRARTPRVPAEPRAARATNGSRRKAAASES
jgi:hypothetical protein